MIVGVGNLPRNLVEKLRMYVDDPRVLINPEFFDSKKELVNRRYNKYVEKVYRYRDVIIAAIYPDYLYKDVYKLCDLPIIWIFPIHSLKEFEIGIPSCVDVVGFAADPRYRDYTVTEFVEKAKMYGYKMWWLGASKREIEIATSMNFWGLDVNTGSTGLSFRKISSPEFPEYFAQFLRKVANNGIKTKVLLQWI